jgi:hypothetical protein
MPTQKENERRKRISEQSKRYHRYSKLDSHIHEDSVNAELMEGMIAYGYVNLCKAIIRHGLENEGIEYMKSDDAQFWTAILRKAIKEDRE